MRGFVGSALRLRNALNASVDVEVEGARGEHGDGVHLDAGVARQKLHQLACVPAYADPDAFRRYLADESGKMRELVVSLAGAK